MTNIKFCISSLSFIFVAFLLGCQSKPPIQQTQNNAIMSKVKSENQENSTPPLPPKNGLRSYVGCPFNITAKKGEVFQIKLKATPGTGYQWIMASDSRIVSYKQEKVLNFEKIENPNVDPKDPPMAGAPSYQVLEFTATETGTETIQLHYLRTFEKGKEPVEKCVIALTVN